MPLKTPFSISWTASWELSTPTTWIWSFHVMFLYRPWLRLQRNIHSSLRSFSRSGYFSISCSVSSGKPYRTGNCSIPRLPHSSHNPPVLPGSPALFRLLWKLPLHGSQWRSVNPHLMRVLAYSPRLPSGFQVIGGYCQILYIAFRIGIDKCDLDASYLLPSCNKFIGSIEAGRGK